MNNIGYLAMICYNLPADMYLSCQQDEAQSDPASQQDLRTAVGQGDSQDGQADAGAGRAAALIQGLGFGDLGAAGGWCGNFEN